MDELDGFLRELESVRPESFDGYQDTATKRACERLLQLSIEVVIDVAHLIVQGERLGLPSDEESLFTKLEDAGFLDEDLAGKAREMKRFRNVLVHRYGRIDDERVFRVLQEDVEDIRDLRDAFLRAVA